MGAKGKIVPLFGGFSTIDRLVWGKIITSCYPNQSVNTRSSKNQFVRLSIKFPKIVVTGASISYGLRSARAYVGFFD